MCTSACAYVWDREKKIVIRSCIVDLIFIATDWFSVCFIRSPKNSIMTTAKSDERACERPAWKSYEPKIVANHKWKKKKKWYKEHWLVRVTRWKRHKIYYSRQTCQIQNANYIYSCNVYVCSLVLLCYYYWICIGARYAMRNLTPSDLVVSTSRNSFLSWYV